jgi:hypothetical protein
MWPNLNKIILPFTALCIILFISGCKGCEGDKPLQKVELTPEAKVLTIKFKRFDKDLFGADFSNPQAACQQLYHTYGSFFCNFVENDLKLAACQSDTVGQLLIPFVKNTDMVETNKEIQKVFTDTKIFALSAELSQAMQRWNTFFPDSIVPNVVYYQSAWNNNIAPLDSSLGIALDCYLGEKNSLTQKLHPEMFPAYQKANMDANFIVADAAKGWVARQARHYYQTKDFLNELIFYGKLMYVAEALVPDQTDEQMMNWSKKELQWAEKNEWKVWKEMANEKVMFSSKRFDINKWFIDAPFTSVQNIPQDSPPQLGVWMGWKIVRQYMQANPAITPQQLLLEKDNQKILAAFKPSKP